MGSRYPSYPYRRSAPDDLKQFAASSGVRDSGSPGTFTRMKEKDYAQPGLTIDLEPGLPVEIERDIKPIISKAELATSARQAARAALYRGLGDLNLAGGLQSLGRAPSEGSTMVCSDDFPGLDTADFRAAGTVICTGAWYHPSSGWGIDPNGNSYGVWKRFASPDLALLGRPIISFQTATGNTWSYYYCFDVPPEWSSGDDLPVLPSDEGGPEAPRPGPRPPVVIGPPLNRPPGGANDPNGDQKKPKNSVRQGAYGKAGLFTEALDVMSCLSKAVSG